MTTLSSLNSGFAAGTLVHTDQGLVPIEQIKVDDMVLSKPEDGHGEQVYKPVIRTIQTENVEVCLVKCILKEVHKQASKEWRGIEYEEFTYITCTPNHPFWIEEKGWIKASLLEDDDEFQLANGRVAIAYGAGDNQGIARPIYIRDGYAYGWNLVSDEESDDESVYSINVELDEGKTRQIDPVKDPDQKEIKKRLGWWRDYPQRYKCTVYNIEVEDFHTYYVGELGLWVHDSQNYQTQ
jgi:hypothetical protein